MVGRRVLGLALHRCGGPRPPRMPRAPAGQLLWATRCFPRPGPRKGRCRGRAGSPRWTAGQGHALVRSSGRAPRSLGSESTRGDSGAREGARAGSWFWPLCSVERDAVARLQGTLVGKTGTWRRRPRNPAASSPAQGPRGPAPAPCRSAALVRLLGCSSSPPKPAFLWLPAPPWLPGPLSPAPRSSVPPLITPGPQRGLCSPSPGV